MGLSSYFTMQDGVVPENRAEFEREYRWLSEGIELLSDVQEFVNTDPGVISVRMKEHDDNPEQHRATNVVVNLCNDAMGSLTNSIRLLLFGAHPDAFALLRSAFEACCYAEFFAFYPNRVTKYLELEELIAKNPEVNLNQEYGKRKLRIADVRKELENRDGQNRSGLYARLCNYGAHPSPRRIALRLSPPRGAVLAALSKSTPAWSRANWTLNCASGLMAVTKYAFEILFEHYLGWFANTPLEKRRKSLVQKYEEYEKMQNAIAELTRMGQAAKAAARKLPTLPTEAKNKALLNIADGLLAREGDIVAANKRDCDEARAGGMDEANLDRLLLSSSRIQAMASDVRTIASLPDPLSESIESRTLPNGLRLEKRRVPIGVVGAIYESRPNVTVDISALCLKSGNAVILRGGREALHSNAALVEVIQDGCRKAGVPEGAVQFVHSPERELVSHMLKMDEAIDLIIPRGGEEFVKFVTENATMPVIASGVGVCHTYVDRLADIDKAVPIAYNAKVQRPSVCNALDTLLVHAEIAQRCLLLIAKEWARAGVEMHCDERSLKILKAVGDSSLKLLPASDEDWGKEFLALVAAIKVVDSLDEALDHIDRYGSKHSEAIVTEDYSSAMRFLAEVDAAVVYANASTRFTDGGQFGLGGEVGISTQKLHARGPLGLRELTTYKWTVMGSGQIRP